MTGADIAQNQLGLTGAGVKVGIIDTGVDVNHPDLGNGPFPNSRVIQGYDFVGDAYNADSRSPSYNPNPFPDNNPDDCAGHGTHVAGIVGANGTVKGVAPGVSFGAYRVFGCAGSTDADVMVAAMERSLADGMQVINMSIGSSLQWPQYPTAQASDRLVNKGVVVVASIGNSADLGLYAAGAPGVGKKVIGVASVDNAKVTLAKFTVSPDDKEIGYIPATGAPKPPTSGTFEMARTGTTTTTNDACSALPAGSLSNKVALIRRGTCTFATKAGNAQRAGAVGVLLYNNAAGFLSPSVTGGGITIPVAGVTAADGSLLNSRIAAGTTSMTWAPGTTLTANPTAGLISSFSSYGLAADLSFKPNLSAPGGSIYSTWPLELGGYATLSGTSMSSPHVAGAAALLLQASPKTNSHAVNGIFQNSADPGLWGGNPGLGFKDNVHRQGAGLVDIDDSILATTSIEPSSLAIGESQAGPATRTLTLTNTSANAVTYNVSHVGALATGPNTFVPGFFLGNASVAFTAPSITVPAGGTAALDATITANSGLQDKSLYGGYIEFTPQATPLTSVQTLRIPYSGFKGDYQSIQVLTPTIYGLPQLLKSTGANPTGAFTLQAGDIPYVFAHFNHQSRLVRMEAINVATGVNLGRVVDLPYFARNTTVNGYYSFGFDGTTTNGSGKAFTVPNGQYVIKVSVTKALGDAANPADVETWTSPAFTVARP